MPPPPPPPPPPEEGPSTGGGSSSGKQHLPFGIAKLKPGAMKTISDDKLATFVIGRQKKTKFQREKEEREAKRREAENEAAKVYESFVASFDGSASSQTFVRGETINQKGGAGGSAGTEYTMQRKDGKPKREMDRMLEEMKAKWSRLCASLQTSRYGKVVDKTQI